MGNRRKHIKIYEPTPNDTLLQALIRLSGDWEAENSCYGYRKNERSDIEPNRIFVVEDEGQLIGYLFGHREQAQNSNSIMADGTPYFEIEELYVIPEQRSRGIGSALYRFAEKTARNEGLEFILLSTATKNYKSILHFYIDELGMEFWSARLYKRLENGNQEN